MNYYNVGQIRENVYYINDEELCTSYLLIGEDKALLIDAGYTITPQNSLKEEVRKITNKECYVILTHAHSDHTGHLDEFDKYYIAEEEFSYRKDLDKTKAIIINDKEYIDLGNYKVQVLKIPGHTPGSIAIIDNKNKLLFTGDEFGSGCGMWLQLNSCLPLSVFKKSAEKLLNYLKNNYDFAIDSWEVWGGHYGQETTGRLGYNPLNIEMIKNYIVLADKLLKNEIEYEKTKEIVCCDEQTYYACYKTAELIFKKSLLK